MAKKRSHKIFELKLDKINARFAQGNLHFMPTHTHTHTHTYIYIHTSLLKHYLQIIYKIRGLYINYTKNTYNSISKKKKKKQIKMGRGSE